MFSSLSLFIGLRYTLTKRRSRSVSFISAVAMTGIVLGVALLITVLSVMNGFDKELRERILSIMPQITVYQRGGLQDWPAMREQLTDVDGVIAATPFIELQAMLHSRAYTQPVLVYGVHDQYEPEVSKIEQYLQAGALQKLGADESVIALGKGIADKLHLSEGESLTLIVPQPDSSQRAAHFQRLTVLEVFETGTELDHSLALMGIAAASKLTNNSEVVNGLHLRINDFFAAPLLANQLRSLLPIDFYTSNWTRTHGNIYYAIQMSKKLVSLLLFLIIAIAAFNVISTLVMVVVDKQSDIAILRTLGASSGLIMKTFMVQGTVIGFIGTAIGAVLGVVLSLSVEQLVGWLEALLNVQFLTSEVYPVSFLPSELRMNDVLLVVSVSLVMSFLATWYPARKAAKVAPAEALRYD